MLVTLEQLSVNLTNILTLIKSYIDARFRKELERSAGNVYCTAIITPEEEIEV